MKICTNTLPSLFLSVRPSHPRCLHFRAVAKHATFLYHVLPLPPFSPSLDIFCLAKRISWVPAQDDQRGQRSPFSLGTSPKPSPHLVSLRSFSLSLSPSPSRSRKRLTLSSPIVAPRRTSTAKHTRVSYGTYTCLASGALLIAVGRALLPVVADAL